MKKIIAIMLTLFLTGILGTAGMTFAENYKYITAKDLNARLTNGSPPLLIDVRKTELFEKAYIKGSIDTNASPMETPEQKARLTKLLPMIQGTTGDIVLLCPKGDKGAKKAYAIFKANGVDVDRMLILENGLNKWPYTFDQKNPTLSQLSKKK